MAEIKGWILSLVAVAVLVAVADGLTPEGMPRRVERLVGGLLMLLVLLGPVMEHWEERLSEALASAYEQEVGYDQSLEDTDRQLLERLITESTQAYIEKEAQGLGISCTAEVECQWQEEVPVPVGVTIRGELTQEEEESLAQLMASQLNIGREHQRYEEGA